MVTAEDMFKLFKLLVVVAGLAGFAWFGLTVRLGERTLFQHVAAIGGSPESQDLVRGTKQKVSEVSRQFGIKTGGGGAGGESADEQAKEPVKDIAKTNAGDESARGGAAAAHGERAIAAGTTVAPRTGVAHGTLRAGRPAERLSQSDTGNMRRLLDERHRKHDTAHP